MPRLFRRLALGFSIAATLLAAHAGAAPAPGAPPPTPAVEESGIDLWPLVVATPDETSVLYPLFVHEDDFSLVFPFYARTREGRDHHLLWPLVKWSDGELERAAPFWFRLPDGEFLFLPFFYQSDRHAFWMIPPTWVAKDRPFSAMLPFYVRADDTIYALPNLRIVDGPGEDLEIDSAALFGWKREGDTREMWLTFLSSAEWGGDRRSLYLLPVLHFENASEDRIGHVGPVYWRDRGERQSAWGVAPFVMTDSTPSAAGGREEALRILWPLYTRKQTTDADGALRERNRRFLLFGDDRAADGTRTLRFLGLPIWERT